MNNWTDEDLADHYRRHPELTGRLEGGRGEQPEPAGAVLAAPDILEEPIMLECTNILERDGWRPLRTDPVSDRGRGKGANELGQADYLYIRYRAGLFGANAHRRNGPDASWLAQAEVMHVEFKRSKGGVVSKTQRLWHAKERCRGALTLIAGEDFTPTVEGFREWYQASGLQRRRDL